MALTRGRPEERLWMWADGAVCGGWLACAAGKPARRKKKKEKKDYGSETKEERFE